MFRIALIGAVLGLSACNDGGEEQMKDCPIDEYRDFTGKNVADLNFPNGLVYRVIGPDTMVTMDYRPDRLNVDVDGAGVVQGVRCG